MGAARRGPRTRRLVTAVALVASMGITASLAPVPAPDPSGPAAAVSDGAARSTVLVGELGDLLRGRPSPVARVAVDTVSALSGEEGIDPGLVARIAALDGVVATTTVSSGMRGLLASVDADGTARDVLPRGMRVPVSVVAIDPETFVDVLVGEVAASDRTALRMLGPGEVLLSRTSAERRGLGAGARVDLGDAAGLLVAGVVDDVATRGSEFVAHRADADAIAGVFDGGETLLVRSSSAEQGDAGAVRVGRRAGDAVLDVLDALVEAAEREGEEVRVWHGGQRVPLVLPTVAVKELFGEFAFRLVLDQREVVLDQAFVDANIVSERMPVIGTVRCHRLIMDDLRAAVDELIAAGYEDWLSPRRYAGCFYPRRIGFGRENLSRHSWGIAIDLNVDFSLPGAGPVPPDELIAIMGRHGFRWGGDFTTPDNHHFEWVGALAQQRPDRT